jgi:hypothetical protein
MEGIELGFTDLSSAQPTYTQANDQNRVDNNANISSERYNIGR